MLNKFDIFLMDLHFVRVDMDMLLFLICSNEAEEVRPFWDQYVQNYLIFY